MKSEGKNSENNALDLADRILRNGQDSDLNKDSKKKMSMKKGKNASSLFA